MESSTIDPRKLLGFRVLLADAVASKDIDAKDSRLGAKVGDIKPQVNGHDVDVRDSRLGAKIGTIKPPPNVE